jgi:peptidoglycan hydrolase CwlO-like protein
MPNASAKDTLKDTLEALNLHLESAVDQLQRCQRTARRAHAIDELEPRIDRALAELAALRNEVREALMRELARGPNKLPVV